MEILAFSSDFNSIGSFIVHSILGSLAGGLFALLYWRRPMKRLGLSAPTQASRPALKLAVGDELADRRGQPRDRHVANRQLCRPAWERSFAGAGRSYVGRTRERDWPF
jgi:hypothetical protein